MEARKIDAFAMRADSVLNMTACGENHGKTEVGDTCRIPRPQFLNYSEQGEAV